MKTNVNTVEELVADETFLAWYYQTDDRNMQAWNKWIIAGMANEELIAEAICLLKQLQFTEKNVTEEQLNAATNRLLYSIKKI